MCESRTPDAAVNNSNIVLLRVLSVFTLGSTTSALGRAALAPYHSLTYVPRETVVPKMVRVA
jgi:hypothetical protein